ncbi:MAG: hypothetical protein KGK07_17350, partial [Chloroflexota bacterium]|nr:hypothetical protein [Chloroflexota bacterium]
LPDDWTWTYPTALTDGQNYLLRVKSADKAGNVRTQDTSFLYDATPAVATITFPTNGSYNTGALTFTGGSFDTAGPGGFASGVSTVAVMIQSQSGATDGMCYGFGAGFAVACPNFIPASGSPGSWTFTPTGGPFVTGQKYLVVAQGTDAAGNAQAVFNAGGVVPSSNTFTYDIATPQVGIAAPIPQANDRETPATLNALSGTAFDPVGGSLALVQLRVRNETGPTYWDPITHVFDLAAGSSEQAWFNAVTADQYANWTSTTNNISFAGLDGSTFTVTARSLNYAGTYSVPYSSNSFVYDSLPPQTGVTLPVNSTYTSTLASLTGTAADLPAVNPGAVATVQLRLERLADGYYWTGTTGVGVWNSGLTTMGAAQGVTVWVSSWNVGSSNLPAPNNLPTGLQTGDSYYITTEGADSADGGGNAEAWNSPRGSTFTFDDIPPVTGILNPLDASFVKSLPSFSGTGFDGVLLST